MYVIVKKFSGSCAEYFVINETGSINVALGKKLDRDCGKILEARGVCFIRIEVSFNFRFENQNIFLQYTGHLRILILSFL